MSSSFTSPLFVALAYLIGALPFAVWVGRARGVDPRSRGSKNPGASNVARTLGLKWGLLTLALDALKGAAGVWLVSFGVPFLSPQSDLQGLTYLHSATAFAAVLGHTTSPFLAGKGGRGVATSAGALLALHSGLGLLCGLVWALTLLITQTPAWASLTLAGLMVALSTHPDVSDPVRLFVILSAALIMVRHWGHLKKLIKR